MGTSAIQKPSQAGEAAKVMPRRSAAGSALLSEADWAETACALRFSGRELQIVRGVFDNLKETAIAADLNIAPRTVDTHLERLYRKLAVTTRVELVLRVIEQVLAKARPEPGSGKVAVAASPIGPRAGAVG